jgi:tetratricopeptide (TPR) repeat protein
MAHVRGTRAARRIRRPSWVSLVRGLIIVTLLTCGAIAFVLWWEDRPLEAIEQALVRKDFQVAIDLADSYLKEYPRRSLAIEQKGRALAGLGRWEEAGQLFDRFGAESPAARRAWSQALLHAERWTEALPLLTFLSASSPHDGDLLHELAACQARLGYFPESIQSAQRLVELPGNDRRGRLLLGMLQYRHGNNRLALEAWQPLLEHDPERGDLQVTGAELRFAAGRAMLNDGRPGDALLQLKRAVELDPSADACNALAETDEGLGMRDAAVALWRRVLDLYPESQSAREGLARDALERRSPEEARRWLEPLLVRNDLRSSTAFLAQRAARLGGDRDEATKWETRANALRSEERHRDALDQLVRDAPQAFWSRCVRAHRFASEGNLIQALILTEELFSQQPDEPFIREMADALRRQKPLPSLDRIPVEQH